MGIESLWLTQLYVRYKLLQFCSRQDVDQYFFGVKRPFCYFFQFCWLPGSTERFLLKVSFYFLNIFTYLSQPPPPATAAAAAKSLQSCPTLCDPIDGSPPGSPVPGILQARTLEWVAISFSNAWKWKVEVKSLSRVLLLVTPWTATYQAPPPMGFSRQQY